MKLRLPSLSSVPSTSSRLLDSQLPQYEDHSRLSMVSVSFPVLIPFGDLPTGSGSPRLEDRKLNELIIFFTKCNQ